MAAKYLVRFDDICPTMNWRIWHEIERILCEFQVQPILAVVPDNHDPKLDVEPARENFWEEVRRWQRLGWTIGLHGYQHLYVTPNAGLLGLNSRSEFAGLPEMEQQDKITRALEIFDREQVRPELWVAPAHSFDANTLMILRRHNLACLSDGFYFYPHRDKHEILWIPQQLWRFRRMPFGVWTICLHHNHWKTGNMTRFRKDLEDFSANMTTVATLRKEYGQRQLLCMDKIVAPGMLVLLRAKGTWSRIKGDGQA